MLTSNNDVVSLFKDQKASDHQVIQASNGILSGPTTFQPDETDEHRPRVHNSEIQRLEREQLYQDQTMRDDYFLDPTDYDDADKNDFTMLKIGEGLLNISLDLLSIGSAEVPSDLTQPPTQSCSALQYFYKAILYGLQ